MIRKIKVLHLTTHNEECGIARYQEQFVDGMKAAKDIENVFFDVSPNITRFMTAQEYAPVLKRFGEQLKESDILHIQHELSFYKHRELESVISLAHSMGKKVIVTIHTALDVEYKKASLKGVSPTALKNYMRELKLQKKFERIHLNPLKKADLVIVHNEVTRQSLIKHGFAAAKITKISLPVPKIPFSTKSDRLKKGLNYKKGDVIFCTVGFISRSKGVDQAVRALTELPQNHKLAIIGGLHPRGGENEFLKEVKSYVKGHKLDNRVLITGYIEDDNELNALIRECDICVYPYDSHYYSFVSSAALNNALANHKATIAYRTPSFAELNSQIEVIKFCAEPNSHNLAATIRTVDVKAQTELSKKYAEQYAYDKEAIEFAKFYRQLA